MELTPEEKRIEAREVTEHNDAVLNLRAILLTDSGRGFLKYLFKSFGIAEAPLKGLEGNELHDYLGFMRAGNSIFKLACQADADIAAETLARIEKEKYAEQVNFHHGPG